MKQIMARDVELIECDVTLRQAKERMQRSNSSLLLACNGSRFVGMLTNRSVKARLARGPQPESVLVRDALESPGAYCFEDHTVDDAIAIMREQSVRRLAVLSRDHHPRGVVSLYDDLLAYASGRRNSRAASRIAPRGSRRPGCIVPSR